MGAVPDKGRKLRVVTLIDQLGITGGAERIATEVVTRLDADRFERTLCVSRWTPKEEADPLIAPRVRILREADVRILGIKRHSRLAFWAWAPLLSLLRAERIDVLHSHQFGSNFWASILGRMAGTPVVIGWQESNAHHFDKASGTRTHKQPAQSHGGSTAVGQGAIHIQTGSLV